MYLIHNLSIYFNIYTYSYTVLFILFNNKVKINILRITSQKLCYFIRLTVKTINLILEHNTIKIIISINKFCHTKKLEHISTKHNVRNQHF